MSTRSKPAFSVPGTSVIPDRIVVSDDEFNAMYIRLVNELFDSAVNVRPVELSHYGCQEIWSSVEQMVDPTLLMHDI